MSTVSKFSAERNQRVLLDLVSKPGNDICADCKARAPRWASHNLGIFLCVNCASIHRKIGTHITKVKSVTMDSWTREQVEIMKSVGNIKSNAKYNPDENRHPPPANREESERDSELEKYIRAKYEFKRFMGYNKAERQSTLSDVAPPPQSRQQSLPSASLARRSSPLPPLPPSGNPLLPNNQQDLQNSDSYITQASVHRSTLPPQPPVSQAPIALPSSAYHLAQPPTSSVSTVLPSSHPVWNDMMSLAAPSSPSKLVDPLDSAKTSSELPSLPSMPNTMVNTPLTVGTPFPRQQINIFPSSPFQQPTAGVSDQRHFNQAWASQVYASSTAYGQTPQTFAAPAYQQASFQHMPGFPPPPQVPLQTNNQFGALWQSQPGQSQSFYDQNHYNAHLWGSM